MDPSDFIRDSLAEGSSADKVLHMLMAYYNLSEEEARLKLDKYLAEEKARERFNKRLEVLKGSGGKERSVMGQPRRLPVRDPEQLERNTALDRMLYLVSNISLLIVLFVCADILAGFMYYMQDGIDSTYLSSVLPKHRVHVRGSSYYLMIVRWPVALVMWPAAYHLMEYYPGEYDDWLKKKVKDETSNVLFRKLAWTLVLIVSFLFQLAVAPPGYTDTGVLRLYRAASIGTVILAVLLNHIAVYLINRKKTFAYCGVSNRFSKAVNYTVIAVFAACVAVEIFVLPVIAGVNTVEDTIFGIIAIIGLVILYFAWRVVSWYFGRRNP